MHNRTWICTNYWLRMCVSDYFCRMWTFQTLCDIIFEKWKVFLVFGSPHTRDLYLYHICVCSAPTACASSRELVMQQTLGQGRSWNSWIKLKVWYTGRETLDKSVPVQQTSGLFFITNSCTQICSGRQARTVIHRCTVPQRRRHSRCACSLFQCIFLNRQKGVTFGEEL